MAMNSPSGPIEATRNASMITGVMMARDREKTEGSLDERERDRLAQEQMMQEQHEAARRRGGFLRRMIDRLPFG